MQLKDIMDQVPCNHLLCNAKPRIHDTIQGHHGPGTLQLLTMQRNDVKNS
jgi:hypothetical protein